MGGNHYEIPAVEFVNIVIDYKLAATIFHIIELEIRMAVAGGHAASFFLAGPVDVDPPDSACYCSYFSLFHF